MIICKTALRLSLIGGGTDYLPYIRAGNDGMCIGTTIDKYLFISCRYLPQFFDFKTQLSYSSVERVQFNSEIQHRPIKAVLDFLGIDDGIDLCHMSDIPSKSGVGSSSSFLVGMIHALRTLQGREQLTKQSLYESAVHIEQNILKETVGLQDCAWAAHGGFNCLRFAKNTGELTVHPISLALPLLEELQNNLLMFFTGFNRVATEVAAKYVPTLADKKAQQSRLYALANETMESLARGDIDSIGTLLHENWMAKKAVSDSISSPRIDEIYDIAMKAGCTGGKLMGAGGGAGCMIFYAPREKRHSVRSALSKVTNIEIPFRFESDGTKIIFQGNKH